METLVITRQRNQDQFYNRNDNFSSTNLGSFSSPHSANFCAVNCRSFQSTQGLLPTPSKPRSTKTHVTENTFSTPFSPKTPSPYLNQSRKTSKGIAKCSTIAIPIKFKIKKFEGDFHFSERWAGPAYSNSPPPSSLPIPKFSMRPKRTVSLDLPNLTSQFNSQPISKSAPASPTRDHSLSPCHPFYFSDSATETSLSPRDSLDISDSGTETSLSSSDPFDISVSATMTLRRILNLDDTD